MILIIYESSHYLTHFPRVGNNIEINWKKFQIKITPSISAVHIFTELLQNSLQNQCPLNSWVFEIVPYITMHAVLHEETFLHDFFCYYLANALELLDDLI